MRLKITPGHRLNGEVQVPGDKSISHRAALLAAIAQGESRLENFLLSGVTRPMLEALRAMGVPWALEGTTLTVRGRGLGRLSVARPVLHCGHSATTMRLLAGTMAGMGTPCRLDGSAALRRRPMRRVVEPLAAMGAAIEATHGDHPPLTLKARPEGMPLKGLTHRLPVASAQVKSAILLAALWAEGPTAVHEPGPSRDHTERLMSMMGVNVQCKRRGRRVTFHPPRGPLRPLRFSLPGDFSSAAFLVVAALITPGSEITLRHVGLNPTRTGLLEALRAMGARIEMAPQKAEQGEPVGRIVASHSPLHGTMISGDLVVRMIDEFPIFAVAAAYARGWTLVRQAHELRLKESDRIASLCRELRALGVEIHEHGDGFALRGGRPPCGGRVNAHGDHRLAMALAVAGLAAQGPVTVAGAQVVAESFPQFAQVLRQLGAEVETWDENDTALD